jgi:5-methylcytosine-specific restriction endonuclease McrA
VTPAFFVEMDKLRRSKSTGTLCVIPSDVKKEAWKRDGGRCVICGETQNLHFDHDLPFSKGGTNFSAKNVRLLCMKQIFKNPVTCH